MLPMIPAADRVRLIFGLKLRQLRQDKGLQINELAELAGFSPSYLNEIEKGKKYPKSEKIFALAKALDTHYDNLVSVTLGKHLEPIEELLHSNILQELPLELFGIEPADLLRMLSEAPSKVSAFISTIIEISRNYGMNVEQFYFSALRSFQELHHNYFEEIEQAAAAFVNEYLKQSGPGFREDWLRNHLETVYGYRIETFDEAGRPELTGIRSVMLPGDDSPGDDSPGNTDILLINQDLESEQRAFTYGREIGFRWMGLSPRPYISSQTEADSFDQVLNNFKASYFAGAILVPRELLVSGLAVFFANPVWNPVAFLNLMRTFEATPEIFMQRISNVMARHFGINELFFLRFDHTKTAGSFKLAKEMHLAKLPFIHGTANEHYCSRWASLSVLEDLAALQQANQWDGAPLCQAQIAEYIDTSNRYLVLTLAKPSPPRKDHNSSLTLSFAINDRLKNLVRFLDDPAMSHQQVNETCERCRLTDCGKRSHPPVIWRRQQRNKQLRAVMPQLRAQYQQP